MINLNFKDVLSKQWNVWNSSWKLYIFVNVRNIYIRTRLSSWISDIGFLQRCNGITRVCARYRAAAAQFPKRWEMASGSQRIISSITWYLMLLFCSYTRWLRVFPMWIGVSRRERQKGLVPANEILTRARNFGESTGQVLCGKGEGEKERDGAWCKTYV